jgi:filamentous hemagglutinin family protein
LRLQLLAGAAFAVLTGAPGVALAQLTLDGGGVQFSAGGSAPVITQAGRSVDITLGAPRTIIPWSSFKLGSDQAAVYRFADRGWIVLNKVSGQAVIDGSIEALVGAQRGGGNVWFQAPGGVLFGPNARVNVGGLLATTGAVAQGGFLDPANLRFDFTGAGTGRVEARGGAQVTASGGALALVAGAISTEAGSTVTGSNGSTVLLGAANEFTVRFVASGGGDLDLVDFVVPTAAAGTTSTTPLDLRGQALGANVYLAVVNRAEVASAVINAPGLVAAQTAMTDRGDVVLTAGVGIIARQPGLTRINTTTETTADLGVVSAQRDLLGGLASPTVLTGERFSAGRDLGFAAASLNVGTLNAGRLLAVDASRGITIRSSASSGSQITLRTGGALVVGGGSGGINAIGRLQIDAGSVQAGQLNSGRSVVVNASGAGAGGGAAVSIAAIVADDDITITTTGAAGHIALGSAAFTAIRTDEAPLGRNLSLTARGASADITYGGAGGAELDGATRAVFSASRDLSLNVLGPLAISNSSAGRDVTAIVSGLLSVSNLTVGRNALLRADDLDIAGAVTAANLRIESRKGAVTLGGSLGGAQGAPGELPAAPLEGMRITDAEFSRLSVTEGVSIYAGAGGSSVRGDLTVLDLRIDPSKTPALLLAAGPDNDVSVTGALAPGVSGGLVTIGETTADNGWQPDRILLSGSIGVPPGSTATTFIDAHALSETHLNAEREIILGSARFIGLVSGVPADQIDIAHDLPTGVAATPEEQGHVFIATGILTLSASARIIMQNTGTRGMPGGLLIDGGAPGTPTTGGPDGTPTISVTTTGVVDLFGSFRDMGGTIYTGLGAGLSPGLTVITASSSGGGGPSTPSIRFNGFDVSPSPGGGKRLPPTLDVRLQVIAQGLDGSLVSPSDADVGGLPPEAPVLESAEADDDAIPLDAVPVSTGSYEIWHRKVKRK